MPFTASSNDCEQHGRDIFAKALSGGYGIIAPYTAPVVPPEVIAAKIKQQIANIESKTVRQLRDIALGRGDVITKNGKTPKQMLTIHDIAIDVLAATLE